MEVKEIICMSKGDNENGYAAGFVTLKIAAKTLPLVEKAVESLLDENSSIFKLHEHEHDKLLVNVADLGCGFGPQPLQFISTMIRIIAKKCSDESKGCCQLVPEIQFYLNDLVRNDFNTLFKGLSNLVREKHNVDVSWFAVGVPGSFHARLFPLSSMHFVHSCYCVHWLSKAPTIIDEGGLPLNKGKMFISKSSPDEVSQAYLSQFQHDFSLFLKLRAQELAPNGRMVLILNGRQSSDRVNDEASYFWDILAEAASFLVSQGLIDKEKLDSLNIPFYNPSQEEVEYLLDKEGSLTTELIDTITFEIGSGSMWPNPESRIECYRSFSEAIVSHQFGEEVMDKLYDKATEILAQDWKQGKEATTLITIVVVLKKKGV